MASSRPLFLAFALSVAAHAFVVRVTDVPLNPPSGNISQPIQIDYLRQEKTALPVPAATTIPENKPAPLRKKWRGIPIPKMPVIAKKQDAPSSVTSAELMADPVQGKIFVGYFGEVKKKIQNTVFQTAGRSLSGRGSVCLGFLLNAEGRLEQLTVLTKGTEADESLKELAVKCIQDSAPFGSFPKELGPQRIFFNITIFFDGL